MNHADLNPQEAEDIVIGQVLYEPECISRAARILKPEHFYGVHHRIVFATALDLWRDGTPVDLITMLHALKKRDKLNEIGGAYRLSGWTNRVAQTIHLEHHAAIIHEQFELRTLRDTGLRVLNEVNVAADPDAIIASLSAGVTLASGTDLGEDVNAGERAYALLNGPKKGNTFRMGLVGIDDHVFVGEDNVIVFTAPSGVGKTSAVMSVVMNMLPFKKPWVVSLEMSADEIITRMLCSLAHVDIDMAMDDRLTPEEKERMAKVASERADEIARMDIDDSGYMTIDQFKAKAEYKVRSCGVELIAVDYGQLMDADKSLWKNATEKYVVVSRGIKAVSRTLKVPILLIVQLGKDGEIYGGGQFEKDAHVVIKLQRTDNSRSLDYHITKNRNGRPDVSGRTPCELRWGIVGRTP